MFFFFFLFGLHLSGFLVRWDHLLDAFLIWCHIYWMLENVFRFRVITSEYWNIFNAIIHFPLLCCMSSTSIFVDVTLINIIPVCKLAYTVSLSDSSMLFSVHSTGTCIFNYVDPVACSWTSMFVIEAVGGSIASRNKLTLIKAKEISRSEYKINIYHWTNK